MQLFDGTGKPYISISGIWVYGANAAISERSPFNAPAMVAWKEPNERRVVDTKGLRGVVVVSSVAYGDGGGAIPGLLLGSPRDAAGNLIMLGTGEQHWSNVHVADLAEVFRRVLEDDTARGYYVIGNGLNPTVAELSEAAAVAAGAPGVVPGSEVEARTRLGDYFAGCCCSIRALTPPGPAPNSAGSRRVRHSPTSSARGVTAQGPNP